MLISAANKEFVTGKTTGRIFDCLRGEQIMSFQHQRFPTLQEFTAFTLGSPQGLAIKDGKKSVTTGAHLASDNTQIISYCGMFDGVCVIWQWGNVSSTNKVDGTWGNNYSAYDSDVKGTTSNLPRRVLLGGDWQTSECGSRACNWNFGGLNLNDFSGFRAVAEPRRTSI